MSKQITLVRHFDPGHSWLAVPRNLIEELGIARRISPYSFEDPATGMAFLEEDCDMGLFESAAEGAGWDITYDETDSDEISPIRRLPRFVRKLRTRAGSWRTFERRFEPIERADGNLLWDIDEPRPPACHHHWWTVLDCEGRLYLSPGYRFVNRLAYVQCKRPWTDDDERQPDYRYD